MGAQTKTGLAAALILAVTTLGCGSDDPSGGGPDAGGGGDPDAGVCPDEPCLAPPANGFQVRSIGTEIAPGQDVEYCEVVQLPGDPSDTYYVTRFESAMTLGSHHLIVGAAPEGSGEFTVGERYDCIAPRLPDGNANLDAVTGSQLPYYEESFPAGVGRVYRGGQYLVFNYHYLNATDAPLQARAAVNFHLTDEASVQHIAAGISFFNFLISIPPGETRSFSKSCTFNSDAMVFKLTRHTHQWGTDFPVYYVGGDRDGELIYTSPNYEDPDYFFEEPILVKAGEGFRWTCNYHNTTDRTLTFGVKATDEMCILFGQIFHPTNRTMADQGCS